MDVLLLHNPKAGNESWSRRDLIKLVRRAGFDPRYLPLPFALEDPKRLEQGKFVIVAGGDGAIRKVALSLIGRGQAIAPLPLGTANNIVRSLGVSLRPEEIVEGWPKAKRRKFDVGIIEGPWGKRHFIEGVGIGLISRSIALIDEIDDEAVYELKKPKHKLHRDICVAAALAREMSPLHAEITLDGRAVSGEFLLLEILNIRRAGPGVNLAPHASSSDGRFDVVSATAAQRDRLWRTLKARLRDTKTNGSSLTDRRARRVRVTVREPCEMRIDDGTISVAADTTFEITMLPGELELILPSS